MLLFLQLRKTKNFIYKIYKYSIGRQMFIKKLIV